ncbi:MAG: hypothetical protein QXJ68_00090 [Methanocellales archaeon]
MIDEFIQGIVIVEGSDIFKFQSEDIDLDFEGYARIFNSQDVKELVVSTEKNYIYAKRYNRNIIILILTKIPPLSISLPRARVAARRINSLYINGSLELIKSLESKVEFGKKTRPKPSFVDSIALSIYHDVAKKEANKSKEDKSKGEREELLELAEEILRFKQTWMEKKKKVEEQ